MSSGLEAIANELRRLQRDGVDRIFVKDNTLRLLVPKRDAQDGQESKPAKSPDHADLKELVERTSRSHKKPEVAAKATIKATTLPDVLSLPEAPQIELPEGDAATQLAWLRERVLACDVCKAHLSEQGQVVFGCGSPQADIFFCGEAPGADEELAGEPFAGKAGQLLAKIISAMGLSQETVYLATIMNWRPQHDKPYGDRPPSIEEMRFCLPYLQAQIEIIRPKVIIALGNVAVTGLLGHDPNRKMGAIRGTWSAFKGIPLMATFHPSYLIRNDTLKTKRMVWEDMLQVMEKCGLDVSEKQRGFFLPRHGQ